MPNKGDHAMRSGICKAGVLIAISALLVGSGCATSGRRVALKEFRPCVPKDPRSSLQGKTVHVAKFVYARDAAVVKTAPKPQKPAGYEYLKFTKDEQKKWDGEVAALSGSFVKSDAVKVGVVRNGYGMVMSGVFILNDPGEWMTKSLEMEVLNQGGRLAPDPKSADVAVSGDITWLAIDMYMKYWADLIVNVKVAAKGKTAENTFHTYGQQTAWSSSSFEFYGPIRQCLQQQMYLIMQSIENAAK